MNRPPRIEPVLNAVAPASATPVLAPDDTLLIRTPQSRVAGAIDAGITLAAWGGFVYLLVLCIGDMVHGAVPATRTAAFSAAGYDVVLFATVAAINALLLLVWAQYNQLRASRERRKRVVQLDDGARAAIFHVAPDTLARLRAQQVATLHCDGGGHLASIEDGQGATRGLVHLVRVA